LPLSRIAIASLFSILGIVGVSASESVADARSGTGESSSPASVNLTAIADELALCADETNHYRASVGLRPLARSTDLEEFAIRAAAHDGVAHVAHDHFVATNGAGVSRAETEILWWRGFNISAVVQRGLAKMWQVGPGGDHYDIMTGAYSEIGCGIAVNGSEVTVTQDFR
jgi:uncharacterized protein YkwD